MVGAAGPREVVEPVAAERARGAGQQEHGRTAGHFFDLRGRRVLTFCSRGRRIDGVLPRRAVWLVGVALGSSRHDCCGYAAFIFVFALRSLSPSKCARSLQFRGCDAFDGVGRPRSNPR